MGTWKRQAISSGDDLPDEQNQLYDDSERTSANLVTVSSSRRLDILFYIVILHLDIMHNANPEWFLDSYSLG